MPGLISHNLYSTDDPSVALTGGGRVIAIVYGSGGDGGDILSATLGGNGGTLLGADHSSTGGEEACVGVFSWSAQSAGNQVLSVSADSGIQNLVYDVYELSAANAPTNFSLTKDGSASIGATLEHSLAAQQNEFSIAFGIGSDGGTFGGSGSVDDDLGNLSSALGTWRNTVIAGSGIDAVVANDPETYRFQFNPAGAGGGAIDRHMVGSIIIPAAVNSDPQLDTPQSDATIQEGQTGTIDTGSNFSDANVGDTLTFSILPDISLVTGFSFNTVDGVITYDGTQAEATAISYTVTADDGNGGTLPTDTFDVTVTPLTMSATSITAGTIYEGDTVTIQLSDANNAAGKTLSCPAGAITVTAQDINSISFSVFDLKIFGTKTLNYNENIPITVTDVGESDSINMQIAPTVGYDFAAITAVEGIYADDITVAIGDYGYGTFLSGTGTVDIPTGNFSADVHSTYRYWVRDTTDGVWSDSAIETFQDPTGTYVTVTTPVDETDGSVFYGYTGSAPVNGDTIIHEPITSPSGIAVTVGADGIWQLASMPSTQETFDAYILHSNNSYDDKATFTFTPPDLTGPTLTLPTDVSTGETTGSGTVTTDDATGTLYFIATTNTTENIATVKAGSSQAVSTSGIQNVLFTGLTGGTTYYAHFVHTDVSGNNSNVSNAAGFLTDAAPDTTAPVLSAPTGDRTGQTTAAGSVTTDEAGGTLYYVITANSNETPATVLAGSQQAVASTGIQNVSFTGLTPGASYYIHYIQVDASSNESNLVSSAQFTTDSAIALVITATSDIHLGATFTVTTSGAYDLTAAVSITATLGGLTLTGLSNVTATTCDFTCPATGLSLVSPSDLILTIDI